MSAKVPADPYAGEEPGERFWHRRYDEQHRTLHAMEDEIAQLRGDLARERSRAQTLAEQSGSALVRAHAMRGQSEIQTDSARARIAKLEEAIDMIIDVAKAGNWTGTEIPDPVGEAIAHAGVVLRRP